MNTAGKVAIGCGIAALLGSLAVVMAIGGLAWYAREQVRDYQAGATEIAARQAELDAIEWSEPEDGSLSEERLQAYLEVRRRFHEAYARYEEVLRPADGDEPSFGDVGRALTMTGELQLARMRAQLAAGMSDAEYAWLTALAYAPGGGAADARAAAAEANRKAIRAIEEMLDREGVTEAQREVLRGEIEKLGGGGPPPASEATRALLERYRAELDRYAGPELDLLAP